MARVKAPMLSLSASGSIGKAITFSRWKGRAYVRTLVKPANPKSGLQTALRVALKFMTQNYKNLSTTIQGRWKVLYPSKHITPLNSEVRFNQTRIRQGQGLVQDPTLAAGAVEAAPTGVTATAQPKSIVLVWVDSVGASDYCTFIYASTTPGFTPAVANLVQVVKHGGLTWTHQKLVTGVAWYYRLGGCENGGTLGTLAAQVTATVL